MKNEELIETPKATTGDHLHSLARAGVGSIPLIGAAATELIQILIAPPLEKRRQEWMNKIAVSLLKLEEEQKVILEKLSTNEAFIDTCLYASQAAIRTNQKEKLEALKNAVINSALPNPPDESRQQIFIGLVDFLTVRHLQILRFLSDPAKIFEEMGKEKPQYSIGGSLSNCLTVAYPELANEREFYNLIAKDLGNRSLAGENPFNGMTTGIGVYQRRTTELGEQFLRFISERK